MNIIENPNNEIDNEVSIMGQKIVDTEAKGESASIVAMWTGMGIFVFFLALALYAVPAVVKKFS